MHTHDHSGLQMPDSPAPDRTSRRSWWVFGGFAAAALFLMAVEHRAHLLGWLPWLILAACPLMHLFTHGGHIGHGGGAGKDEK